MEKTKRHILHFTKQEIISALNEKYNLDIPDEVFCFDYVRSGDHPIQISWDEK